MPYALPMLHTRGVRIALLASLLAACLVPARDCAAQHAPTWPSAVAHAAHFDPAARIVVLDQATGRLLASNRLAESARTLANPGSAMKPLELYGLVSAGLWDPSQRIECTRKMTIGTHSLDCSHPPMPPFDAREALTWSCNTYFATVAASVPPGQLRNLLAPTGILGQTGLAPGEATAVFNDPQTSDEIKLAFLGVDGVRVTPLEFASAYRWLAQEFAAHPDSAATQVVRLGMEDSASFGMAGAADLGGVAVAGKTGTASSEPSGAGPVHGWFLCLAPAESPQAVIAVYLPIGHGNAAARVAADLLAHSPLKSTP
jgi:cell division protein FtsI/penicillin-binding protein 2